VLSCRMRYRRESSGLVYLLAWEAMGKVCGVPVARPLGQSRGPRRQNDSVPLSANLSTSWSGSCAVEQLPWALRARSARPLTVPVKLPVAPANCPVPPVTCQVSRDVPVNRQLCGLI